MTDTPEIRVPVIDQQGNPGTIPQSQLHDAVFKDKLFTLAPVSPVKQVDLGSDGRVNVVDPTTGELGTLPIDDLQGALKPKNQGGGGYMLQSTYDNFQSPEVKKNMELIPKSAYGASGGESWTHVMDMLFFGAERDHLSTNEVKGSQETRQLRHEHQYDDVVTREGQFKMVGPGGLLNIPVEAVNQARAAGYKFQDPKFQALYDAHVFLGRSPTTKDQLIGTAGANATAKGLVGSIPIVGSVVNSVKNSLVSDPALDASQRALELASDSPEVEAGYQGVHNVGTAIGIGAQLLAPEGLLGEVALASKAAKAVKAVKVLEGSPILASALSHAAQGMTIAAPQVADALIKGNPKLAAESLGLGLLGGVVLGELPNAINAAGRKVTQYAEGKLPGITDKTLGSLGAEADVLKLQSQAKQKIVDTLAEAGLKESANAESTLKVLNEVSGGSHISVLGKLDQVAEERILTAPLTAEINGLVRAEGSAIKVSPELEKAVNGLNSKMEKMFPRGEATLAQMQKLSAELTEGITKVRAASEVNNFNIQARDLVMNELFRVGDMAAMKADAQVAALWTEQKGIAQAATQMQGGFASEIAAAEHMAGAELSQTLKDKIIRGGVKHLFHAAGVAAGHMVLPHVGGWIGGKLGGEFGESIAPFLKNILPDSTGKAWILRNADNPHISSYLAMNAIHNTNIHVSQIPEFIKNPAIKSTLFAATSDPIKTLLGSESNGLSKSQQFDRLSNKVALLAGNDQLRDSYLTSVTAVLAKNHPELAGSLKQELNNKIQIVNQLLHQGNQGQPVAFQKQQRYEPSKDKMAEIEAGLNAIHNPYSIIGGLKDGKVSQKQVAIVQQTHPAIFQEIVNAINKEAYSGKTDLNHQQRLSASIITGQPMDPSLKNGAALQSTYAPTNNNTPAPSPSPKSRKGGNSKSLHADKISPYTAAQRITK